MLRELRIENFAIIHALELQFDSGLIILTGETGAGKSIVLDAVEILVGGRVDAAMIRADAPRALVEGVFRLDGAERATIHAILEKEDLLDDPRYLVLSREIRREGRNVARVNGRTVNVGLLKSLGAALVDIHGQSEHLSLLNPRSHLGLLDRYAETASLRSRYHETYEALRAARSELDSLRKAQADSERRIELLTYQAEEIEAANLKPGEDERLRQERDRLANAETLATLARQALVLLDDGSSESTAITDLFGQVAQSLRALAKIDSSQTDRADRSDALLEELTDLARDLRDYLESIEFRPERLDEVEARLDTIASLKRKYGDTIEEIVTYAENARRELETITHATERIEALEKEETALLEKLASLGNALSQKRKEAAKTLGEKVEAELAALRMSQARFAVDFQIRPDEAGLPLPDGTRAAFDASGMDKVEFLIAPNPGEGLKPLAKIASGGETSRLMLALKNVLAQADEIPTLIFDEIDQGIGGRVGLVVGEKLHALARRHQVFCVTHLPQLAAFGDEHWQVQKVIENGRTLTRVEKLEENERLLELAQMLGGVGEGTLRSAHEILHAARESTQNGE
jgi:DNA repair protein RecN (Recombination protein N)